MNFDKERYETAKANLRAYREKQQSQSDSDISDVVDYVKKNHNVDLGYEEAQRLIGYCKGKQGVPGAWILPSLIL